VGKEPDSLQSRSNGKWVNNLDRIGRGIIKLRIGFLKGLLGGKRLGERGPGKRSADINERKGKNLTTWRC